MYTSGAAQCVAACRVLQCVAVCYSVLQCVAVCYSVLQCVAVCYIVLQCVAVCYSVLQCVEVCCSVLQCITLIAKLAFENISQWCSTTHMTHVAHRNMNLAPFAPILKKNFPQDSQKRVL